MEILHGVWKQHLRPRAVVGYGLKIFLPSPPNYVTRSPGKAALSTQLFEDPEGWYGRGSDPQPPTRLSDIQPTD